MKDIAKTTDTVTAGMVCGARPDARARAGGVYKIQCVGADGQVKWEEEMHNLVMNVGLQDMNAKYFTGAAYTATWFIGLITGPGSGTTFSATDTLASKAWTEFTSYSGVRKTATFGTPSTADPSVATNSASPASFTMTGSGTIAGAFLTNVSSGTSGLLFSASDFQAPGDRTVVSTDVLNVTYTFSLDAV